MSKKHKKHFKQNIPVPKHEEDILDAETEAVVEHIKEVKAEEASNSGLKKGEYQHSCIKCQKPYKDLDVEDYYCNTCRAESKQIAEQIDKNLLGKVKRNVKSDWEVYNSQPKVRGFPVFKL